eukprot:TRINITY_DN7419_c0_g6_i1.p1 TRINITY_DN7419_c0_g6~~TRINITY_DN7419_c0_g6_i1.p1  ORF type:complete len:550 (-),score=85.06 TRINITY_DN7419_c0_g6_i1:562-2211(-)
MDAAESERDRDPVDDVAEGVLSKSSMEVAQSTECIERQTVRHKSESDECGRSVPENPLDVVAEGALSTSSLEVAQDTESSEGQNLRHEPESDECGRSVPEAVTEKPLDVVAEGPLRKHSIEVAQDTECSEGQSVRHQVESDECGGPVPEALTENSVDVVAERVLRKFSMEVAQDTESSEGQTLRHEAESDEHGGPVLESVTENCERGSPGSKDIIEEGNESAGSGKDRVEQYECPFAGCGLLFPSLDFLLFHWPLHRSEEALKDDEEEAEGSGRVGPGLEGDCSPSSTFAGRSGEGAEGEASTMFGGIEGFYRFGIGAKRKHVHLDTESCEQSAKAFRPLLPNNVTPPPRRFTIPPALAPPEPSSEARTGPGPFENPEPPLPSATAAGSPTLPVSPLLGTPLVGGDAFPVPEALKSRALQSSRWLPLTTWPSFCRDCLASPGCGPSTHAGAGSGGAQTGSEQPPEVWNPPREEQPSRQPTAAAFPLPDKQLRDFMAFAELSQYVQLLEEEWVTMTELPKLSDKELGSLGLPMGACKKLRRALLRYDRER